MKKNKKYLVLLLREKKMWYLFNEMSFLSSFMLQHKQTSSNLEASDDESEATDSEKSTENPNLNESVN